MMICDGCTSQYTVDCSGKETGSDNEEDRITDVEEPVGYQHVKHRFGCEHTYVVK